MNNLLVSDNVRTDLSYSCHCQFDIVIDFKDGNILAATLF